MWRKLNDVTHFKGWEKVPTPISQFEYYCVLRHKPIMRFGSPANTLWPECDRGGVISCTGWHTSLSCPRALHSQNHATTAVSAAWQEDIFTTWGLSYMEQAVCTQKGTPPTPPTHITQICIGQTCLCTHACVHRVNHKAFLINHAISAYLWVVIGYGLVLKWSVD